MKKIIALMVSAVMAAGLAACGSTGSTPATASATSSDTARTETGGETKAETDTTAPLSGRLAAIKEAGVLRVATSPDYPPYEFEDLSKSGQDKYAGADMELARYIADKLGVRLEINAMAFDACLASVSEGRDDLTLCGMVPKDERKTAMDFTKVYYNDGGQVIVALKEQADQYQSLADFAGKKVAAQNGTLQYDLVKKQLPDSQCELITAIPDGIMMLKTGKIDAIALASISADNYVANYPELAICKPAFEYHSLGVVAGVVKNEPEFLDTLNEIIDEVIESKIYYQWIEEASTLSNQVQGQ